MNQKQKIILEWERYRARHIDDLNYEFDDFADLYSRVKLFLLTELAKPFAKPLSLTGEIGMPDPRAIVNFSHIRDYYPAIIIHAGSVVIADLFDQQDEVEIARQNYLYARADYLQALAFDPPIISLSFPHVTSNSPNSKETVQ